MSDLICNKRFQHLSKIISERKAKGQTHNVEKHQENVKCQAKTPGGICKESSQEIYVEVVSTLVATTARKGSETQG